MPSKYNKKIVIGKSADGSSVSKSFGAKTARELKQKIDDYKYKMRSGEMFSESISFSSWADTWLNSFKIEPGHLSDSTVYGYSLCVQNMKDYFGDKAILQRISVIDLQNFFNSIASKSESTCNKMKVTCKAIFKKAQANGYIRVNPCEGVEYPKGIPAEERRSYTIEEYKKVLSLAREHPDGLGAYVILSTGMRRGEAMGFIPSEDINYSKRIVYMRRTVTDINGLVSLKDGGKTKNATRAIPVQDDFIDYFKTHYFDHTGLLFKSRDNKYRSPRSWARHDYARFCDDLKKLYPDIPVLRPHELRHTFGTLLYKAGTDIYTLQKIMGHSSVDITTKIYVHDDEDDLLRGVKFM